MENIIMITTVPYPVFFQRHAELLDGLWDFHFAGDTPCAIANVPYDDLMPVPGVFDMSPRYIGKRGFAYYRKKVLAPANRKIRLHIGGLGFRASIFWDGVEVGVDDLPYSGMDFVFDSGNGETHELVFEIDNRFHKELSPLLHQYYDFYCYGGFYRSVELHVLPDCWFERVRVTTEDLTTGQVQLDIRLGGNVPETFAFDLAFDTGAYKTFCEKPVNGRILLSLPVPDFKLWSPETPNLHTVSLRTADDGITERFGIRTVTTGEGKIYINGKSIRLKGFCRHESHPQFGPVQPRQLLIEDLQNLRTLGCNFVRGSHYPQDPQFLDLCDQLGFLVWEESLGWGNRTEQMANPSFFNSQVRQTGLMVRNSYNHPCIILWGFLNEGCSWEAANRPLYEALVKAIKEEDTSRLVTCALMGKLQDQCVLDLMDVISMNQYPAWYAYNPDEVRPLHEIPEAIERIRTAIIDGGHQNKAFILSEIGAGAIYGWRDRMRAHWSEEYQADYLGTVLDVMKENPWMTGIALWHFADARTYTSSYALGRPRTINDKGILDDFRRPKLAFDVVKEKFPTIN